MDGNRACIYLRISLDQTGEGLAHERQREDCLAIVKRRGWTLVGEYTDEVSASDKSVKRPGYNKMVTAYDRGEFDALVCYDLDRLTRQPRQLEDWIDAAEERGLALVTANGEADLTTDGGRTYARVKVAFAKGEVERKAARQRRAAKQRSELGRPPLGVRLTGYTVKGEVVPDEAEIIRRIFKLFHHGESLRSITKMLTDDGVRTRRGTPWNPSTIRSILVNPRYAGRAVYQGETQPLTEEKGGGYRMGNWEPLVPGDVFDVIQARLADPRRVTNRQGTDRKHLGSGIYLCSDCEQPVRSWSGSRYRCAAGHIIRSHSQVDPWVLAVVAERIRDSGSEIAAGMSNTDRSSAGALAELDTLRNRRARTEADYDQDLIDGRRYRAKMERIAADIELVERKLARESDCPALAEVLAAADPAEAFLDAPLMSQRSIIDKLVTVRLYRGTRGVKAFDKDTVEVTPK
jgi:DNA invertase Pin-like site-specific DNA recombinase